MSRPARPCAIGLDFGTASVRALVVECQTGAERGSAVVEYRHGVIEETLPGTRIALGADWALQCPGDYLEALAAAVPEALRHADVRPDDVIGLGVDFTSCTILPIDSSGLPLSEDARFRDRPHAWVKLWKHHAAQPQADRINAVARARAERFFDAYGGRTSSEWLCAKALQVVDEDPHIYEAAWAFVEAGDWLVQQLTGNLVRNACAAGYKGFWNADLGFPTADFYEALNPRFGEFGAKLRGPVTAPGRAVGALLPTMASRLGLSPGIAVASAIIDAHSAVPAATVVTPGRMVMVLGTSTCHMLLSDRDAPVEGIAGRVRDGIVEGFVGYEAGQAAVGDIFSWCAAQMSGGRGDPASFAALEKAASDSGPGARGVLALDWLNGNRSVLVNADLSGALLGLTLSTTPGDIYRSLMEATGFGTRRILDAFEQQRVAVDELIAVGGLAARSPLLLQIYADITGRPISRAATSCASALGAAMLGAVAAGESGGGHQTLAEASRHMARLASGTVEPSPGAASIYDALYREYLELHDYFGRGGNDVLMRLRRKKGTGVVS